MELMKVLCISGAVAIMALVIIIVPSVLLTRQEAFLDTFMERCLDFTEGKEDCENISTIFQEAYVGINKCNVSAENYDLLFDRIPFKHPCDRTMFWSKTYDVVHEFTEKGGCFYTLEDTLLGYVLDQQSWCGQTGSDETFTKNCEECTPNPVHSFWEKASNEFALHACGEAWVMLDGERAEPYDSNSFFGSVEVPSLQPLQVTNLTVVLVTLEDGRNCTCDSLGSLRQDLDFRIDCSCKAVTKLHIEKCIKDNNPCETCW